MDASFKAKGKVFCTWLQWLLKAGLALIIFHFYGCASSGYHIKKDWAPPFHVDCSKIPEPVPKPERISKYGNPVSYNVLGRQYYVMNNFKGYHERGLASWYGMGYQKRHTSDGEVFNTLSVSGAHRSLPIPCYVRVRNLENGRSLIVRVNDRGPFVSDDRIIDLSYAAAVKLGVYPKGTAYVDVAAIDPYEYQRTRIFRPSYQSPHRNTRPHLYYAEESAHKKLKKYKNLD